MAVPVLGQRVSRPAPRAVPPVSPVGGIRQRACHIPRPGVRTAHRRVYWPGPDGPGRRTVGGRDVSGGSNMTRIVAALVAGIGGLLLTTTAYADDPPTSSTPVVTGAPATTAGPVIYSGGDNSGDSTAPARRGLFGRIRRPNPYSGPGYSGPGYYTTPTGGPVMTTGPAVPMLGTTIPAPMPANRSTSGPAALNAPQPLPSTGTTTSLYPGTTSGTTTPPAGTMIINGRVVPASGTITLADGKVVPAAGTNVTIDSSVLPANYYDNGSSQPARRGLFGRRYR